MSLKALAGPPSSRNRAAVQMSKPPRFSMTRTPPASDAHTVSSVPHAHGQWMARVPPAPPHQLLEPRLIASMQFELISCFRWSLANQGRQEAEVGAIKLTTLGPGSLRKKKTKQAPEGPSPHPASPSLGKPGTAARAEHRASPTPPHPGPTTPRANNAPLWQLILHRQTACGSCQDLVNKEQRHKPVRGGRGVG